MLAVEHPELFHAAYPVSSWLPEPLWPSGRASEAAAGLPITLLHGEDDTVLSAAQTRLGVERLAALGHDVTMVTFAGASHSLIPMIAELRERLAERAAELTTGRARGPAPGHSPSP